MEQMLYENPQRASYIKKSIKSGSNYIEYYKNDLFYSGIYPEVPLKISFTLIPTIYSLIHTVRKVLILGTGMGGLAIQLKELNPHCIITTVDIDDNVEFLAKAYFGLDRYNDIHFVTADAISFVAQTKEKFDYIIVDIFDGDKIPAGIISKYFIGQLFRLLERDGFIAINTNMRELSFMGGYGGINPICYVYKLVYDAGFRSIMQNDFHNSGWLFAYKKKTSLLEVKEAFAQKFFEVLDIYQRCSIAVQLLFLSEIREMVESEFDHVEDQYSTDIITQYRQYVFRSVIALARANKHENSPFCKLRESAIGSLIRKIKGGAFNQDLGKDLFKSRDEIYFLELDSTSNELVLNKQFSLYIREILLPCEVNLSIFARVKERSFLLRLVYALGLYLQDDISFAETIIESIHKEYDA